MRMSSALAWRLLLRLGTITAQKITNGHPGPLPATWRLYFSRRFVYFGARRARPDVVRLLEVPEPCVSSSCVSLLPRLFS